MNEDRIGYWDDFYEQTRDFRSQSQFCEWTLSQLFKRNIVVDVSAGDGTDSLAFLSKGHFVIATEGSKKALEWTSRKMKRVESEYDLVYLVFGNSGSETNFLSTLEKHRKKLGTEVVFYIRFILHAITELEENSLIETLGATAKTGDKIFLEFRNVRDSETYEFGNHYRRNVNPLVVFDKLESIGFQNLQILISKDFALYKSERPMITRMVGEFN